MNRKAVTVALHDPAWRAEFLRIKRELEEALGDFALAVEHVGSTSVEGLAAKPIIDIDVVIADYSVFGYVKDRLAAAGYEHQGDLGIADRHAFKYSDKPELMKHHLYVCPADSAELARHLAFRDYLRRCPEDRDWYGAVKTLAAKLHPFDIDGYMAAKDPCCKEILRRITMSDDRISI